MCILSTLEGFGVKGLEAFGLRHSIHRRRNMVKPVPNLP